MSMNFNLWEQKINKPQQLIYVFFIIFVVGILILILSKSNKNEITKEEFIENTKVYNNEVSDTYRKNIEEKLEEEFAKIEGVGKVEVIVTMKTKGEIVLNKDTPVTLSTSNEQDSQGGYRKSENSETKETTVLLNKSDGSQEPIIIKEYLPEVSGILIIAEGGDNVIVKNNLINAAKVLLDIPVHKIEVMKMVSK